jgi:hypothetical protein
LLYTIIIIFILLYILALVTCSYNKHNYSSWSQFVFLTSVLFYICSMLEY